MSSLEYVLRHTSIAYSESILNQYTYNLLNAMKYHKILRNVIMWNVVWYNMIWFYAIEVLTLTLWIYLYKFIMFILLYLSKK